MMQSDYNHDLFSNMLLQVSIECDRQIDRFEHLLGVEMKKNEYKTRHELISIFTFLPRSLLPGNQPIQHKFVRRQIRQILSNKSVRYSTFDIPSTGWTIKLLWRELYNVDFTSIIETPKSARRQTES